MRPVSKRHQKIVFVLFYSNVFLWPNGAINWQIFKFFGLNKFAKQLLPPFYGIFKL